MAGYPYGAPDTTHAQAYYYNSPSVHGQWPELAGGLLPEVGFKRGLRRRLSLVPILLSLLIPWAFFCILFAVVSFQIHYNEPWICYLVIGLGLAAVVIAGCVVVDGAHRKLRGDRYEPTWFVFLFLTLLLAWIVAMMAGGYNYSYNSKPFYDIQALETYVSVDPSDMRGDQLMDGGRFLFAPGAHLDITKSMGFKRSDMYCVAPVTTVPRTNDTKLETYDFWAVGVNCCSSTLTAPADYHCGQFANPRANGGLRLMVDDDDERPFYRLAVQQAEAAYKIKATHPLFFTWVQDPTAEAFKLQRAARMFCLIGIFVYFVVQLFLVLVTTVLFSKLGKF